MGEQIGIFPQDPYFSGAPVDAEYILEAANAVLINSHLLTISNAGPAGGNNGDIWLEY